MMVLAVVLAALAASSGAANPSPEASLQTDDDMALEEAFEAPSGTTTHYVALLMKGPRWSGEDTGERRDLRQRRRRHLRALAGAGYLIAGGPVPGRGQVRGILVLRASSLTAAHVLVAQDPAVKAGRLVVEVHPWIVTRRFSRTGLEPDDATPAGDQALAR